MKLSLWNHHHENYCLPVDFPNKNSLCPEQGAREALITTDLYKLFLLHSLLPSIKFGITYTLLIKNK